MSSIENSYTNLARSSGDLCAFMLVCQSGKLSVAAEEMKISQPSMSQRIKNLEAFLGRELFVRHSSGMDLNHDGQRLLNYLQNPMEQLARKYQEFQDEEKADRVVISVDHAFASFWLLPKLPLLREELGTTDICIVTSQDPISGAGPETDITIFMEDQSKVSIDSTRLFQECISVVCSPRFKQSYPGISGPQSVIDLGLPLLHVNSPRKKAPWLDWSQWLTSVDVTFGLLSSGTVFNSYEMIIKAARKGQGVALGWHGLVDELLASNELCVLFSEQVTTDVGYYIDHGSNTCPPKVKRVRDWIVAQSELSQNT